MPSKIRDRIVDHAIICFAAHGYSGCSTKEIATRANVTEGSLFRLFGSKEKLFAETIEKVKSASLPAATYQQILDSGTLEKAIPAALTAVFKRVSTDGLRLNRFTMLESPQLARKAILPVYDSRIKPLAKRIRKAIAKGEVRKDIDARFAAESLFLSVLNFHCERMFFDCSKKAQLAHAEKFIGIWLRGILK